MPYRLLHGFSKLSGAAREQRWKLMLKTSSIFGDPLECNDRPAKKGEIVNEKGNSRLVISLDETQAIPDKVTIVGKTFTLSEAKEEDEKDPEQKRFETIEKKFTNMADMVIDKFGMKIALKVAKWNSRLDILISYAVLGLELIAGPLVLAGVCIALAKNSTKELLEKVIEEYDPVQITLKIGAIGTAGFVVFAWFRQFWDDIQQILVNRVKIRMHDRHPEQYKEFLDLEKKYTEMEITKVESNFFYAMVQSLPILGNFVKNVLDEIYNIKIEKREIAALKEMERFVREREL